MKKLMVFLNLLLAMVLLSGCMTVNISGGVDKNYNTHLSYHVQMDTTKMDSKLVWEICQFLDDTVARYMNHGFTLSGGYMEEQIDFVLRREEEAESYKEAYEILKEILNDPAISFFLATDMTTHVEDYEQAFAFRAEADLNQIVEATTLETLPSSIQEMILEGIENSDVTFTLILPVSEVIDVSDDAIVKVEKDEILIHFPIDWNEPTNMNLLARMSVDEGRVVPFTIEESIMQVEDTILLYKVLLGVGVAGGVLSLSLLVYFSLKKKRAVSCEVE